MLDRIEINNTISGNKTPLEVANELNKNGKTTAAFVYCINKAQIEKVSDKDRVMLCHNIILKLMNVIYHREHFPTHVENMISRDLIKYVSIYDYEVVLPALWSAITDVKSRIIKCPHPCRKCSLECIVNQTLLLYANLIVHNKTGVEDIIDFYTEIELMLNGYEVLRSNMGLESNSYMFYDYIPKLILNS